MIVYHGSDCLVEKPDVLHSFRDLDFGRGFYVTTVREQADRWARRKGRVSRTGTALLNIYEMAEDTGPLRFKDFGASLDEWIDFVCECRDGGLSYLQYDVIVGRVANDKVYRVVDMYHSGIWDKDRALREMRAYEGYDQIAFITQEAIDRLLVFDHVERL